MSELSQNAITLLSTTNVDLSTTAQTTLYTVPTGKSLIIDSIILTAGSDTGASTLTIGQSGALTDFLSTITLQTSTAGNAFYLIPVPSATPALQVSYPAGMIIQVDVTGNSGGSTNSVQLFGYLV